MTKNQRQINARRFIFSSNPMGFGRNKIFAIWDRKEGSWSDMYGNKEEAREEFNLLKHKRAKITQVWDKKSRQWWD